MMYKTPDSYGVEILRSEVGSTLHGTGLGVALEDHDEMGIFVELPDTTIGLKQVDHYEYRTAQKNAKSNPGDTDLIVYSLRKWARLALNGNPSVLLLLHAPEEKLVINDYLGDELRANKDWFASQRSGKAFLGYMTRQRMRMTGERGKAGRVRTMPDGKVDWKYAMHLLRLGYQGVEFLSTGKITLPIPDDVGDNMRAVRRGEVPLEDVIKQAELLELSMKTLLTETSPLPEEPAIDQVHEWVINAHMRTWGV